VCEDLAGFLARRVGVEDALSPRATEGELLAVCARRGVQVARNAGLRGPGYYRSWPIPQMVLRPDAPPHIAAHELYHHLLADNAEYGITYEPPDWYPGELEEAANRFARLVCGEPLIQIDP